MVQLRNLLAFTSFVCLSTSLHLPLSPFRRLPRQANTTTPTLVYRIQGGWIEGLVAASTTPTHLLFTRLDAPDLWLLDPVSKNATKLISVPDMGATAGLVEMYTGVFAVVAGKYANMRNTPKSWAVYRADLRSFSSIELIANVTDATQLNGLAKIDTDTVLAGDMGGGAIYKVVLSTGEKSLWLKDPTMDPDTRFPFGIDGLQFHDGYLYYTNIGKKTMHRLPVTDGKPGALELVYSNSAGDDFTFDKSGNIYVATNSANSVIKVTPDGKVTTFATVPRSTCTAIIGNTLYIGTGAGEIFSVPL